MKEQRGPIKEQQGLVSDEQQLSHFGNYDLVRRIDMGGMGEVYLARQRTAFGREVAVKIIRFDLVHDITARKRFLREAEVSAHLKHEHILQLVEFGEEQGRLFLVTPYIEGGTLSRRLQHGSLSLAEVQPLFTVLVQAVAYIHRRGVVHRDLKPSNILLDQTEGSDEVYVRLIDFGIASIQGASASPPLTESGTEMGTLAYMAPERLNGIAASSNDIYSLGVILYQLLVGHLPRVGESVRLATPLEAVIRRSTAVNVEDRFATAEELLKAFKQACQAVATISQKQLVVQVQPQVQPATPHISETSDDQVSADELSAKVETPTVRRTATHHRLSDYVMPEGRITSTAPRVEVVLSPLSSSTSTFCDADYNAPTTSIDPASVAPVNKSRKLAHDAVLTPRAPAYRQQPKRSVLVLIPVSIIVVVLLIIATTLFAYQAAVSAHVTVAPQVQAISRVLTINAKPGITSVDTTTSTIPITNLTKTESGSDTGQTTGRQLLCFFGNCPRVVSSADVSRVGLQLKQQLTTKLTQELNSQLHTQNATALGDPTFTDVTGSYNPQIDEPSDTVTVNLTEQGAVNYYSNTDVQTLARQLLAQQAGAKYQLIDTFTRIGTAVIKSSNPVNGTMVLAVPAAGVAEYQLSPTDLQNIQEHIKGMKIKDARAFIAKQPGINTNAIVVTVSVGDTIPGDVRQINLVSTNPTNIPAVQLPKVN
jgi:serine/threonine protein kinase